MSLDLTRIFIAWYQERGAGVSSGAPLVGRSFYTSLGHSASTWQVGIFIIFLCRVLNNATSGRDFSGAHDGSYQMGAGCSHNTRI